MPISPFQRAAREGLTTNPSNNPPRKRPRGRPPEGTEDWAPAFIGALMEGASVRRACRVVGIHITTPYERRKRDKEFLNAWREASDIGTEFLEQEAARRAFHGTIKPVFHKGEKCGFVTDYSDTLMIFLLKARKPGTYRDMVEQGKGATTSVNVVQSNIAAAAVVREMIERGELGLIEEMRAPDQSGALGHQGLAREVEACAPLEGDQQCAGERSEDAE